MNLSAIVRGIFALAVALASSPACAQVLVDFDGAARGAGSPGQGRAAPGLAEPAPRSEPKGPPPHWVDKELTHSMQETAWQQFLRGFLGRPMRPSRAGEAIPAVHREGHKIWEQAELERSGYVLTPRGIEKIGDPSAVLSLRDPAHGPAIESIVKGIAQRNHLEGDPRFIPAFIKSLQIIQPCLTDHSLPQCRNGGAQAPGSAPAPLGMLKFLPSATLRSVKPAEDPVIVAALGAEIIGRDALLTALASADIVYVGEAHDQASHHQAQLEVLKGLHSRRPGVILGLEMLDITQQKTLDDFLEGRMGEGEFARGCLRLPGPARPHQKPMLRSTLKRFPFSLATAVALSGRSASTR